MVKDPETAVRDSHAIVILTEWDEFKSYDWEKFYKIMLKPSHIFDGRILLDSMSLKEIGFKVYQIGKKLMLDISENLRIAIKAAIIAGNEVLKIYNKDNFEVKLKSDNSPLTTADERSNKIIIDHLTFTKIPIISEESDQINYEERKNFKNFGLLTLLMELKNL